jgi:hypothetical protein
MNGLEPALCVCMAPANSRIVDLPDMRVGEVAGRARRFYCLCFKSCHLFTVCFAVIVTFTCVAVDVFEGTLYFYPYVLFCSSTCQCILMSFTVACFCT